jgi:hypothetical protein
MSKIPIHQTDLRKHPTGTVVTRGDGIEGFILSIDPNSISYPVKIQFPDMDETYTPSGKLHIGSVSQRDIAYVSEATVVEVPKAKQDPHLDSRDFFVKTLGGIL